MNLKERKDNRQKLLQKYDFDHLAETYTDLSIKRRLICMALLKNGDTIHSAAQKTNVSWVSVRNWLYKFEKNDINGLFDRQRTGRKSKLNKAEMVEMHQEVIALVMRFRENRKRLYAIYIQKMIKKKFHISYCASTIYKILKSLGLPILTKNIRINSLYITYNDENIKIY